MDLHQKQTDFEQLYAGHGAEIQRQKKRYAVLSETFQKTFGEKPRYWFNTPGRTEIGGNHTDHNHGRVLAASVNLDAVAAVLKNDQAKVILVSEGFEKPFIVALNDLQKRPQEIGTTTALIRGIAHRLNELGYEIGGFKAYVQSDVLPGSGLSSSAAIEVLIGTIFNYLFNHGEIPGETIAQAGQFAENEFFGKPCGLMDQMACAVGGIVAIDFKNPRAPQIEKIPFDLARQGYRLLVVDTGGNHADLTEDYAAVPNEMKAVAKALGKSVCREVTMEEWLEHVAELRRTVGDRALLRAYHFIRENARVAEQVRALKEGDFSRFLKLINDSGHSSFRWLQNIYTTQNPREQGLSLALALSEDFIQTIGEGACRVHGGGFAGTIQAFLPTAGVADYTRRMESVFGEGCVKVLTIRNTGSVAVRMDSI